MRQRGPEPRVSAALGLHPRLDTAGWRACSWASSLVVCRRHSRRAPLPVCLERLQQFTAAVLLVTKVTEVSPMSLFRVPQIWRSKDLDYFTSRASLDPSDLFRSSPRTVKSEVVQARFALRRPRARPVLSACGEHWFLRKHCLLLTRNRRNLQAHNLF